MEFNNNSNPQQESRSSKRKRDDEDEDTEDEGYVDSFTEEVPNKQSASDNGDQDCAGAVMNLPPPESSKLDVDEFLCQVPGCPERFTDTVVYDKHYAAKHRHVCATCKKHLVSAHILELHVLETHDTLFSLMAEKKPMYRCFIEACPDSFKTGKERNAHCVSIHQFAKHFASLIGAKNLNPSKSQKAKAKDKNGSSKKNEKGRPSSGPCEGKQGATKPKPQIKEPEHLKNPDIKMDTDTPDTMVEGTDPSSCLPGPSRSTNKTLPKQQSKPSDKKPNTGMHISFGRHAPRAFAFKKNVQFGASTERKTEENPPANSMDFSEVEAAVSDIVTDVKA